MPASRWVLVLLLTALVAYARPQHMNAKSSGCDAAATTFDLTSCFSRANRTAKAELNAYYNRLTSLLAQSPDDLSSLRRRETLGAIPRCNMCGGIPPLRRWYWRATDTSCMFGGAHTRAIGSPSDVLWMVVGEVQRPVRAILHIRWWFTQFFLPQALVPAWQHRVQVPSNFLPWVVCRF